MILFHNEDVDYARWLEHNPNGYVINVKSRGSRPMLHTARCWHLYPSDYYDRATGVPKACSVDRQRLETWAREAEHDLVLCTTCKPWR